MPWGGRQQAIVTGSSDGALRRWTLAGNLSQERYGTGRDVVSKLGRSIQALVPWDEKLVVAAGERVVVLDESFNILAEATVGQKINAMCVLSPQTVAVAGQDLLGEVNLASGAFTRTVSVPSKTEYVAVAPLGGDIVAAATAKGEVRAVSLRSGQELGEFETDFPVRGLSLSGKALLAFGGAWRVDGKAVASLLWEVAEAQPDP